MTTAAPNPARARAGRLGGLTTVVRHGEEHFRALGQARARQQFAGQPPAARRLWALRMRQLRGKSPEERARIRARWNQEAGQS